MWLRFRIGYSWMDCGRSSKKIGLAKGGDNVSTAKGNPMGSCIGQGLSRLPLAEFPGFMAKLGLRIGVLWLMLGLFSLVGHAQIGTPGDIGSKETNISSASVSLITTQAVPAGASIIVIALGSAVSPGTTGSCSDSGGDPYSVDVSAGITDFAIICSTHKLAAPLGAGATITVMFSSIAVSGSNVHAFSVTGLAAAPLD